MKVEKNAWRRQREPLQHKTRKNLCRCVDVERETGRKISKTPALRLHADCITLFNYVMATSLHHAEELVFHLVWYWFIFPVWADWSAGWGEDEVSVLQPSWVSVEEQTGLETNAEVLQRIICSGLCVPAVSLLRERDSFSDEPAGTKYTSFISLTDGCTKTFSRALIGNMLRLKHISIWKDQLSALEVKTSWKHSWTAPAALRLRYDRRAAWMRRCWCFYQFTSTWDGNVPNIYLHPYNSLAAALASPWQF